MFAACVCAARLAFKVPALAAASNEELQEHMNTLEQVRLSPCHCMLDQLHC
jgi:hypothetical protein